VEIEKAQSIIKTVKDTVDVIGDSIGLVASPSTFFILTLYNSTGKGRGFDGYITNPVVTLSGGAGAGLTGHAYKKYVIVPVPRTPGTPLYQVYFASGGLATNTVFNTFDDAKAWINEQP
jgi:hypothetical protein